MHVTFLKSLPPAIFDVPPEGVQPRGSWSQAFGKIKDAKGDARSLPVFAVQVTPRLEGGIVKANVSLLMGQKSADREDLVADYTIRENEVITVEELKKFGIEPIDIKIVRIVPQEAALPDVTNQTQSLSVTRLASVEGPFPTFRIFIKNNTQKEVAAFSWRVLLNGTRVVSTLSQGTEGRVLIAAGATYALTVPAEYQSRVMPDGRVRDLTQGHNFILEEVVFKDGTYEGSAEIAAEFGALSRGRANVIRQILAAISEVQKSDDGSPASLLRFKATLLGLSNSPDDRELVALSQRYPDLPPETTRRLNSAFQGAATPVRAEVIQDLDRFEAAVSAGTEQRSLQSWLAATHNRYAQWLSRLNPEN